ncbi:TIGR02206 family membrane protein [Virgibacillus flavescens]|uniref:YwaF family protein n=1 Tax=Virgibacillus flavescens TaxID=1611422 RepID=UPI003D34BA1F
MLNNYFTFKSADNYFTLYSFPHLSMLGLAVLLGITVYALRNKEKAHYIKFIILGGLIVSELTLNIWYFYSGEWDAASTLPFQLCSITLYLSVLMLLTGNYRLFEVTYFLGIGGALQALLTPELYFGFPHFRFYQFFIAHISIVLASFYMIFVQRKAPVLKSVWRALLWINVVAGTVFLINKLTGGNYMFLSEKPDNPSILDYLGDYPFYLISLEIAAVVLFLILYVPFPLVRYIKSSTFKHRKS